MEHSRREPEDSSFLIQLVYPAMVDMGLDVERIAALSHITPRLLRDGQARFPHAAQAQFWRVVEELSGDPHIGMHLTARMPVYKGQVLEYLFLSSATFGEGLRRALSYQRLVTDAMQLRLSQSGNQAQLELAFSGDYAPSLRHRDESFALFLIRLFKAITNDGFRPDAVHFRHAAIGDMSEYRKVFACETRFEQAQLAVHFPVAVLATPSSQAQPELLRLHEQLASEHLARLQRQDIVGEVRRVIGETLEMGQPELSAVARRLDISARELRRRLTEVGSSFNQILNDYRCHLAKRLLAGTDENISEVVYLTGFSEPSTFYRAFKRWTGMTPVAYREDKRRQSLPACD